MYRVNCLIFFVVKLTSLPRLFIKNYHHTLIVIEINIININNHVISIFKC